MRIDLKLYGLDALLVALAWIFSHMYIVALNLGYMKTADCILIPLIGLIIMGAFELIGSYRKNVQRRINRISMILQRYHQHKLSQRSALSKIDDLFLK